jgi:hypothetical protein
MGAPQPQAEGAEPAQGMTAATARLLVLLVNGGGASTGVTAPTSPTPGEGVHAVGSLAPIVEGHVGCIVIRPDGSRHLAHVMADPLA